MDQSISLPQLYEWLTTFMFSIDDNPVDYYCLYEDDIISIFNEEDDDLTEIYSAFINTAGMVMAYNESNELIASIHFYGKCDPRTSVSC